MQRTTEKQVNKLFEIYRKAIESNWIVSRILYVYSNSTENCRVLQKSATNEVIFGCELIAKECACKTTRNWEMLQKYDWTRWILRSNQLKTQNRELLKKNEWWKKTVERISEWRSRNLKHRLNRLSAIKIKQKLFKNI